MAILLNRSYVILVCLTHYNKTYYAEKKPVNRPHITVLFTYIFPNIYWSIYEL